LYKPFFTWHSLSTMHLSYNEHHKRHSILYVSDADIIK
jgi:hypothetical protein